MNKELAYRYFAFISYSSKDKKVAEKIQKKIEAYRLPTVLRNELEAINKKKYPQHVRPLFRDMTDFESRVDVHDRDVGRAADSPLSDHAATLYRVHTYS